MKYKKPRIYRIFPMKISEAFCGDGASAVSMSCVAGPEASGGCKSGAAAAATCLPGAAAGMSCNAGTGFD